MATNMQTLMCQLRVFVNRLVALMTFANGPMTTANLSTRRTVRRQKGTPPAGRCATQTITTSTSSRSPVLGCWSAPGASSASCQTATPSTSDLPSATKQEKSSKVRNCKIHIFIICLTLIALGQNFRQTFKNFDHADMILMPKKLHIHFKLIFILLFLAFFFQIIVTKSRYLEHGLYILQIYCVLQEFSESRLGQRSNVAVEKDTNILLVQVFSNYHNYPIVGVISVTLSLTKIPSQRFPFPARQKTNYTRSSEIGARVQMRVRCVKFAAHVFAFDKFDAPSLPVFVLTEPLTRR
jgi:hypothetical protein